MRFLRSASIRIFMAGALLWLAPVAAAQGNAFGAGGDIDSEAGLESATPTNAANEVNTNGAANGSFGNAGGNGNLAAPSNNVGNLNNGGGENIGNDAESPSNQGSNDLGGNAAGNGNFPSNGGEGGNPALQGANAAPANVPPANVPANAPANAQSLLQNPSFSQSNVPANAAATPSVEGAANAAEDTGLKMIAPPLPPPNEFSGAPPVPGSIRQLADGEAPEEYFVQAGDTLFDICDQLLSEAGYWPKLWALNPEIKNPHFIFPNMRLRFYPGDEDTPPYLQVVAEDDVIPIDKGELDEEQLVAEKVVFDVQEITEGVPIDVVGPAEVDGEFGDLVQGGRAYSGDTIAVQVPGFIYRDERDPVGFVIGGAAGEIAVGPGRKVLIEASGSLAAGTRYSVLRRGEDVYEPDTGDSVGVKYYFVANVKVQRSLETDVFVGVVDENLLQVRADDILVNFIETRRVLPQTEVGFALGNANANVVGFQHFGQEMGGQGGFAFLDKGSGGGISPGMYLPIYSTPGYLSMSTGSADLPENWESIGVIRIIDTTDAGACGYIVVNDNEVRVGDRTGKG